MTSELTVNQKVGVLVEALPWLEQFQGATVVVKFGGNAMIDDALLQAFAQDIVYLRLSGLRPVVVHGGGPQISAGLKAKGIESEFKAGLRVTTPEAMEVVHEVLVNQIGQQLVALINEHGDLAEGIAGTSSHLLTAERRDVMIDGVPTDIGQVGEVTRVDASAVFQLLEWGKIPVISGVARGTDGQFYNINADTAASAIAVALKAEKFVMLTDVPGLYRNWPDTSDLINEITVTELQAMLPKLDSGMVPKMEACISAVQGGLKQATVIDGRVPHSVLLEVFTDQGMGTMVVPAAN